MAVLDYDFKVGITDAGSQGLIARVLCWVLHSFRAAVHCSRLAWQRTLCAMLPFCDRRVSVARKDVAPVWTRSFPISKEPKTLGEHLKKKRFRMGMRQEEVARPTTIARYRDRLALKAEDEGWTGFTTKLVKTLLFAHRREKAPPAWAVFHFSRADWRVNFSGCC